MQKSFVILTAFLIASVSASSFVRRDDKTQVCTEFDTRDPTQARCDANPNLTCTKGCVGSVAGINCTLNNGTSSSAPVNVSCNKSWGKSSAATYTCGSDQGPYTCTSSAGGNATCSGCVSGAPTGNTSTTTPTTTPDTTPGGTSSGNGTAQPSSGGGTQGSGGSGGSSSPNNAQGFASGSMFAAYVGALIAGVASIVV